MSGDSNLLSVDLGLFDICPLLLVLRYIYTIARVCKWVRVCMYVRKVLGCVHGEC